MLSLIYQCSQCSEEYDLHILYHSNKVNKFGDYCNRNRKKAWNFEIYLGFLEGVEEELRAGSISCHKILLTPLNLKSICMLYEICE